MKNTVEIYVDNLPAGSVIMWYGNKANIPIGWVLCDGNNNTPDLRGMFVVGASHDPILQPPPLEEDNDSYSNEQRYDTERRYELKQQGGNKFNTLHENHLPAHTHKVNGKIRGGDHKHYWQGYYRFIRALGTDGARSHKPVENDPSEPVTIDSGAHSHDVDLESGATGMNIPIENRPPFYALYYIMKSR